MPFSKSLTKEEIKERRREYYRKNAEKIKEENRKSYNNRDVEKHKERKRRYYNSNPDRQKEAQKRYRSKSSGKTPSVKQPRSDTSSKLKTRAFRLKHKYKMTQDEWDAMFTS